MSTVRERVDSTEHVELTTVRRSNGRRSYSIRVLWMGRPLTFAYVTGTAARLRAIARAIKRALPPARRRRIGARSCRP